MLMLFLIGFCGLAVGAIGSFILVRKLEKKKHNRLLAEETVELWARVAKEVDTKVAKQLADKEVLLLGSGGPEDGKNVVQRLRQLGFTVLETLVAPRPHMLGWLFIYVSSRTEKTPCPYCRAGKTYELVEVAEAANESCSVDNVFLVIANVVGSICNNCGVFWRISRKSDAARSEEYGTPDSMSGFFWSLLEKADNCNLFDILNHIQTSTLMNEKICEYLEELRQLLGREADKISTTITRYQLQEACNSSGEPYRTQAFPEPNSPLKMLKQSE